MNDSDFRYTASDVCAVADVQAPTLRGWRNRGFLTLEHRNRSSESEWNLYTIRDVARVCAVAELTRQGVSLEVAARCLPRFSSALSDWRANTSEASFIVLERSGVVDGAFTPRDLARYLHSQATTAAVIVLNIGLIWEQVKAGLSERGR